MPCKDIHGIGHKMCSAAEVQEIVASAIMNHEQKVNLSQPPIIHAGRSRSVEKVNLLFKYGAEPAKIDVSGRSRTHTCMKQTLNDLLGYVHAYSECPSPLSLYNV